MSNQLDLYLQSLREEQATEEEDTIYSNDEFLDSSIPQKIASYGYNTLIKEPDLESVNSSTEYISTSNKKPLSVLKSDKEFQKRAARFLDGVGENDENIIEYLRDADYSISAALSRSIQTGGWTEEQKQDYIYLKEQFNNTELDNWKQRIAAAKDITIDLIADPFNLLALIATPYTGGTSAAVGATISAGTSQALKASTTAAIKKIAASKIKKDTTKKYAKIGTLEGATWGGLHDYFLQDMDMDLGYQDNIDLTRLTISTGIGGLFGATLGGTAGYVSGVRRINKLDDNSPELMPQPLQEKEYKFSNEYDIINSSKKTNKENVLEESKLDSFINTTANGTNWLISNTFGKPTTNLINQAKKSKKVQEFLGNIRYDWDVTITSQGAKGPKKKSYGLSVGERTGSYSFALNKALNVLDRVGFRARLTKEQSTNLNFLLREDMLVGTKRQAQNDGKFWIKDMIGKDYKGVIITEELAFAFGGRKVATKVNGKKTTSIVYDGTGGIRNLLDRTYNDLSSAGLFKQGTFNKGGFMPRLFNYTKLSKKENREKFEKLLIKAGHADPINDIELTKIKLEDGTQAQGIAEDALGKDIEIFGVDFLDKAGGDVIEARKIKANRIVQDMLDQRWTPFEIKIMTKDKIVTDTSGTLQARRFTNLKDNEINFVLENDTQTILEDYLTNAARTIERVNYFGKNIVDFEKRFVNPAITELKANGMSITEAEKVGDKMRFMQQRVAGIETYASSPLKKYAALRHTADAAKLIQQMAHLPFATISSVTEPLLLFSRAGKADAPAVVGNIISALFSEINNGMSRSFRGFQRGVLRKKVKGFKDVDNETWEELYETGLALEQSVMERIEGLAGEGMHSNFTKNLQQGFFKVNLLTQWTKAVQLAAFTTGKRLVLKNSEKLSKGGLSKSKEKYLRQQLEDLGIDSNDAVSWYNKSLKKDGTFDAELSKTLTTKNGDNFYKKQYLSGANRFTKEIILNPSTAEANRPLWFSTPAAQMLVQFAGYPTVFNNTILKRFFYEGVKDVKQFKKTGSISAFQSIPKVLPTAILMTTIAHQMNIIRSNGRNLYDYETGEPESNSRLATEAVRRWGLLGPLDYAYRYDNEAERNVGTLTAGLKTFAGPLPQDVIDGILYRKGLTEIAVSNTPFIGALPYELKKDMKSWARKKDDTEETPKSRNYNSKGGIVKNVPNVTDEPDEMKSRVTGQPFNATSEAAQDIEDRELKAQMEGLGLREPFVLGGFASTVAKQLAKKGVQISNKINANENEVLDIYYRIYDFTQNEYKEWFNKLPKAKQEKILKLEENYLPKFDYDETGKIVNKLESSEVIGSGHHSGPPVKIFPHVLEFYKDNPEIKQLEQINLNVVSPLHRNFHLRIWE
tara:strand:+ start:4586 stop:8707 length:4122 start_codon:yes stop_codon:yes gene_type:complete